LVSEKIVVFLQTKKEKRMAYSIRKSTGRNSGFSPKPNKILGCTRKGAWGADGGDGKLSPLCFHQLVFYGHEKKYRPLKNSFLYQKKVVSL
jgi:hypothetical protein